MTLPKLFNILFFSICLESSLRKSSVRDYKFNSFFLTSFILINFVVATISHKILKAILSKLKVKVSHVNYKRTQQEASNELLHYLYKYYEINILLTYTLISFFLPLLLESRPMTLYYVKLLNPRK